MGNSCAVIQGPSKFAENVGFHICGPMQNVQLLGFLRESKNGEFTTMMDLTVVNIGGIPKDQIPTVEVNEDCDKTETLENSGCKVSIQNGLQIKHVDKDKLVETLETHCKFDEMYGNPKFVYAVYEIRAAKQFNVELHKHIRKSSLFGSSESKTDIEFSNAEKEDKWRVFGFKVAKFKVCQNRTLKYAHESM